MLQLLVGKLNYLPLLAKVKGGDWAACYNSLRGVELPATAGERGERLGPGGTACTPPTHQDHDGR